MNMIIYDFAIYELMMNVNLFQETTHQCEQLLKGGMCCSLSSILALTDLP